MYVEVKELNTLFTAIHDKGYTIIGPRVQDGAIILDTLARLDPDNSLAPNAVRWLMAGRTAGHWETTQETAWSLIALTDWMVETGELEGDYGWGVQLNGELLARDNVTRENIQDTTIIQVAAADLMRDEANRLAIEKGPGPGRLYYTAHMRTFLPVEQVRALNRGVIVAREYTLASCDPTGTCPNVVRINVTAYWNSI